MLVSSWDAVIEETYDIVKEQLRNFAFDSTLALTLGIKGEYEVLKIFYHRYRTYSRTVKI